MGRIAVMTAGGDCPGLNAVIRGVVGRVEDRGQGGVVGIRNGWEGLIENQVKRLDRDAVRGILQRGGTILGTSRLDPYVHADGLRSITNTLEAHRIDCLVVIGGDGTLKTALRLADEGLNVVGVPKTIDNDIAGTDITFGFDTAVQIATDAIDRITTTAESHNRVILVEVMGRTKGWIATYAGIAAGADAVLIPEMEYDLDEIASIVSRREDAGSNYSVIVVAEGVTPPAGTERTVRKDVFGFERLGGVAYQIAPEIEERTGFETRVSVLGHIQRGGTPTAFDRVLATRLGVAAADSALDGTDRVMMAVRGMQIEAIPLEEACATVRGVDPKLYEVARTFFS